MIVQWDLKIVFQIGYVFGDGDQVYCIWSMGWIYIEVVGEGMGVGLDVISLDVEGYGECLDVFVVVVIMVGVVSYLVLYKIEVSD